VCQGAPAGAELCTPENENCDPSGNGYDGLECTPGATQPCDICTTPPVVGSRTCRSVCTYDFCAPPPVDLSWTPGSSAFVPYSPVRGHAEGTDWVATFDEIRSDVFWRINFDLVHGSRVALAPGRYRLIVRARWDGATPAVIPNLGVEIRWDVEMPGGIRGQVASVRDAGGMELTGSSTFTLDRCAGGEIVFFTSFVHEPTDGTIRIRSAQLIRED
jgi:hypothetical protein